MHSSHHENSNDDIEQSAADWWLKMQDPNQECTAAFEAWLSKDSRHQAVYDQFDSVSKSLGTLPDSVKAKLRNRAKSTGSQQPWYRAIFGQLKQHLTAVVLSVGFAACIIVAIHLYLTLPIYSTEIRTARGQVETIVLPDESQLVLDTNTALKVTYYRDRREVAIVDGQALFTVTKDPAKPFHVYAGSAKVTVVGTIFTVRYLGGHVSVAVREGKVNVSKFDKHGDIEVVTPYLLTVGQALELDAHGQFSEVRSVAINDVDAWTRGRLVFDNTRLEDAINEFARYARINLVVRDRKVADYRITGSFERTKLDTFAKALSSVLPVELERDGADIQVVPR